MAKGIKFKDVRNTAGMGPLDAIAKRGGTGKYAPDRGALDANNPKDKIRIDELKAASAKIVADKVSAQAAPMRKARHLEAVAKRLKAKRY